ncbi:MAG: tricarboxylate transporter [Halomonas sp.]|nr:tricarboxylate transporter [Halomonas sp.]
MNPLDTRKALFARMKQAAGLGLLCTGLGSLALPASAESTQGNVPDSIEWTIPFGVGGGTDVWARFFAPWFSDYLPGEPNIMINNVPGGGSINGANLFAVRAKADGSEWLGTSASTQYPAMLDDPRVRYDYADWKPILATPTGGVVYASPSMGKDAETALEALLKKPVKLAAQSPTGVELPVLIALEMLGVNVDPVFGMRSRGEGRLAFERGEANIDFQTTSAYLSNVQPLVEDGKAIPLFSLGVLNDEGKIVRDPTFPNLPTFNEVYQQVKGEAPSGNAYEAYRKFFASGYALQKLVMVPVGTPESLTETYRQAAREFIKTDKFKQEAEAQLGPYTPIIGETVSAHIKDAMEISDETRQWLINWLAEKYDVHVATAH